MKSLQKFYLRLPLAGCLILTAGCAAQRWQIVDSHYTAAGFEQETNSNFSTSIPILLDTRTGKSWMLYPITGDPKRTEDEDDHGYSWVSVPFK